MGRGRCSAEGVGVGGVGVGGVGVGGVGVGGVAGPFLLLLVDCALANSRRVGRRYA